ncbi:MAG: hypothetical protein ACTSP4_09310 [Candidatus Hodarchaeales archaeon]
MRSVERGGLSRQKFVLVYKGFKDSWKKMSRDNAIYDGKECSGKEWRGRRSVNRKKRQ